MRLNNDSSSPGKGQRVLYTLCSHAITVPSTRAVCVYSGLTAVQEDCKHFLSSRHQHVLHSHISQPVHGGEGGGGDGRGADGDRDSSGTFTL